MAKRSQKSVNYRQTSAGDRANNRRCGTCSMFVVKALRNGRDQVSCTAVESPIDPRKICDIYEPKRDTMAKFAKRKAPPSVPPAAQQAAEDLPGETPPIAASVKALPKKKALARGKDQPRFPKVAADYVS